MALPGTPVGAHSPGVATLSLDEELVLPGGSAIMLRAMREDDAEGLVRFHHRLSAETTYLRFFSPHPELSVREVDRFTHVDHLDREAFVVVADGEIVGVGRLERLADPCSAEVAFAVDDSWQGRGVGRVLFEALARRAQEVGVTRFVAETLAHNRRMLNLFRSVDRPVTTSFADGNVRVEIDLEPRAEAASR